MVTEKSDKAALRDAAIKRAGLVKVKEYKTEYNLVPPAPQGQAEPPPSEAKAALPGLRMKHQRATVMISLITRLRIGKRR